MKRIFYSVAVIATVAVAAYGIFLSQQKNSVAAFSDLILSEVETLAGNEAGDKDDDDDGFQTTCTVTYNCTQNGIQNGTISCTGKECSRGSYYDKNTKKEVRYVTCDGHTVTC